MSTVTVVSCTAQSFVFARQDKSQFSLPGDKVYELWNLNPRIASGELTQDEVIFDEALESDDYSNAASCIIELDEPELLA